MLSRLLKLENSLEIDGLPLQISYNLWTGTASVSYGGLRIEKMLVWNGGEIHISNIRIKFKGYLNPYIEIYVNNHYMLRLVAALSLKLNILNKYIEPAIGIMSRRLNPQQNSSRIENLLVNLQLNILYLVS
jgi:hypothetical protein